MGEPIIAPLKNKNGDWVRGFYFAERSEGKEGAVFTRNLIHGQRFHENELFFPVGGTQYRVMNPARSKLAVALCAGFRNTFVIPDHNLLYLANDASSVVTISHLSDIVGDNGNVYVAFRQLNIGPAIQILNQRENTHILHGVDTTNAAQCKELIESMGRKIDIMYCDVGHVNQVNCMFDHASLLMKEGGYFVALLRANTVAYTVNPQVVVPPDLVISHEMNMLEKFKFKCVEAITLGRFGSWACVGGFFDPFDRVTIDIQGSASNYASTSGCSSSSPSSSGYTESDMEDVEAWPI